MNSRAIFRWRLPRRTLLLGKRTLIMGVLNVTPDSFSDGGEFVKTETAVKCALAMQKAGADILDVGGESTRPGSHGISASEELRRVLPVLEALRSRLRIPISIDTRKAAVAEAASHAGAEIVNDVTAFRADAEMACVAQRRQLGVILMHMRGDPRSMQRQPFARNVLREVSSGLREAVRCAETTGVLPSRIVLDPGIGFGKSFQQNYELLARLSALARLGYPLLVGTSRKTFLGKTLRGAPPQARIWGNAATVAASILEGAHIVRVHDVAEMTQVALVADEVLKAASAATSRK